jgi:hypothetical protein
VTARTCPQDHEPCDLCPDLCTSLVMEWEMAPIVAALDAQDESAP